MAFTYDSLMAYPIPEVREQLSDERCILYSLGVGLGSDPTHAGQLRYVYEEGLVANPFMANVIGYPGFWMKAEDTGVDWKHVLHGEQYFELHRPIPTHAEVVGRSRVVAINDRGPDKGAFVYTDRVVSDAVTDEPICTITQTTVCRGDGGCGGSDAAPRPPHPLPERSPDTRHTLPIAANAALLYRLNGDLNPLHVDPQVATHAGYPQPILHGLCTLGHAGHAILAVACGYEAQRLRSVAVRFTAPVFPGETLRVDVWHETGGVAFCAHAVERDVRVLGNGFAETDPS
jgi:acyl dehydratase